MENEDQIIRELLKKGMLKTAPEDFTENVMLAVAKTEEQKKTASDFSFLTYSLIITASVGASLGAIYFLNPSFFQYMLTFFSGFLGQIFLSFHNVFDGTLSWSPGFKLNSLVVGVVGIMAALLAFDVFLKRRKKHLNLFV